MTHDEAITLFMNSISRHIDGSAAGTVLTSSQLSTFLVQGSTNEDLLSFVAVFGGECGCPNTKCMNRVVDAVTKCMTFLRHRSEAKAQPQNAPTTRLVQ